MEFHHFPYFMKILKLSLEESASISWEIHLGERRLWKIMLLGSCKDSSFLIVMVASIHVCHFLPYHLEWVVVIVDSCGCGGYGYLFYVFSMWIWLLVAMVPCSYGFCSLILVTMDSFGL
eukprot:Gb_11777 [translate_table: standard]